MATGLFGFLVAAAGLIPFRGHSTVLLSGIALSGAGTIVWLFALARANRNVSRAQKLAIAFPLLVVGNVLMLVTFDYLDGNTIAILASVAVIGVAVAIVFSDAEARQALVGPEYRPMVGLWLLAPLMLISVLITALLVAVAITDSNTGVAVAAAVVAIADVLMGRQVRKKIRSRRMASKAQ